MVFIEWRDTKGVFIEMRDTKVVFIGWKDTKVVFIEMRDTKVVFIEMRDTKVVFIEWRDTKVVFLEWRDTKVVFIEWRDIYFCNRTPTCSISVYYIHFGTLFDIQLICYFMVAIEILEDLPCNYFVTARSHLQNNRSVNLYLHVCFDL